MVFFCCCFCTTLWLVGLDDAMSDERDVPCRIEQAHHRVASHRGADVREPVLFAPPRRRTLTLDRERQPSIPLGVFGCLLVSSGESDRGDLGAGEE